jgi:hypothetical protein
MACIEVRRTKVVHIQVPVILLQGEVAKTSLYSHQLVPLLIFSNNPCLTMLRLPSQLIFATTTSSFRNRLHCNDCFQALYLSVKPKRSCSRVLLVGAFVSFLQPNAKVASFRHSCFDLRRSCTDTLGDHCLTSFRSFQYDQLRYENSVEQVANREYQDSRKGDQYLDLVTWP